LLYTYLSVFFNQVIDYSNVVVWILDSLYRSEEEEKTYAKMQPDPNGDTNGHEEKEKKTFNRSVEKGVTFWKL